MRNGVGVLAAFHLYMLWQQMGSEVDLAISTGFGVGVFKKAREAARNVARANLKQK